MSDQAARIELLRSVQLFQDLPESDLGSLADHCVEGAVPAGSPIFNRGDPASAMYLVVRGQVTFICQIRAHAAYRLTIWRAVNTSARWLCSTSNLALERSATTDVTLLEPSRSALLSMLQERPSAALIMLRTLASRVRNMSEMLEQHVSKNAVAEFEERLTWTDRLANRVAEANGSWVFILSLVAMTLVWAVVNSSSLMSRPPFDPYPFVFFNLVLAVLVGLRGRSS